MGKLFGDFTITPYRFERLLRLNPALPGLAEEGQGCPVDLAEKAHAGELGRQAPPLALRLRAEVFRAAGNRGPCLGLIGVEAVSPERTRQGLQSGWLRFRASSTHRAYPPGLIWRRTRGLAARSTDLDLQRCFLTGPRPAMEHDSLVVFGNEAPKEPRAGRRWGRGRWSGCSSSLRHLRALQYPHTLSPGGDDGPVH